MPTPALGNPLGATYTSTYMYYEQLTNYKITMIPLLIN